MSRTEFLRALRQKLLESMSASEADEQVRYYDDYIKKAVRSGQNEREVLAALGDPVLIARTILEASGRREGEPRREYIPKEENPYREQEEKLKHIKRVSTFGCILGLIVALVILFVVFKAVGLVLGLAFRVLAPVLLVVILVVLIKNLNRR